MIDRFDDISTVVAPKIRGEVEFKVVDEKTGETVYEHKQPNMWFDQGLKNFLDKKTVSMILVNDTTPYTYKTTSINTGYVANINPSLSWEGTYSRYKLGGVFASADRTFNRIGLAANSDGSSAYCCTTLTNPYHQEVGQILYIYYYVYIDFEKTSGISKYESDWWKSNVPFRSSYDNNYCGRPYTYSSLCVYKYSIPTISNTLYSSPKNNRYNYTGESFNIPSNYDNSHWRGSLDSSKYRRLVKNASLGDSSHLSSYSYSAITGLAVNYFGAVSKFSGKHVGRTWIKNRWSSASWFDSAVEAIPSGWWQAVNFRTETANNLPWKSYNKFEIYPLVSGDLSVSSYVYKTYKNHKFFLEGDMGDTTSTYGNGDNRNIEVMEKFNRTLIIKSTRTSQYNHYSSGTELSTILYDINTDEYAAIGPVRSGGYVLHDDGILDNYICQLCDAYPSYSDRYLFKLFEFDDPNDFHSDYTTHDVETVDQHKPIHGQVVDYNGVPKILTQIPALDSRQFQMIDISTKTWEDWWVTDLGKQLGQNININDNILWGSYNKTKDSMILVTDSCAQIMSLDGITDINPLSIDGSTGEVDLYSSYVGWSNLRQSSNAKYTKNNVNDTLKLYSPSEMTPDGVSSDVSYYGLLMDSGQFDIEIELENIKPFCQGQTIGFGVMDPQDVNDVCPTYPSIVAGRYIGFDTSSTLTFDPNVDTPSDVILLEDFVDDVNTGNPVSDDDIMNPSTPSEITWTVGTGDYVNTEIHAFHSWTGATWYYGNDGTKTYIKSDVVSFNRQNVYDYAYIDITITPSNKPRYFTFDYKHQIQHGNNDDNNYFWVYSGLRTILSFRPSYSDTSWHTSDKLFVAPGIDRVRIQYRTEWSNYESAGAYIAYSNFTFNEFDIIGDYNDSINEDVSGWDFNVKGFDINPNSPYDVINETSTTLVDGTDIDINNPRGKLRVVRDASDLIHIYYDVYNGSSWAGWTEINGSVNSTISDEALIILYVKNGDNNITSFTSTLTDYTINTGSFNRKVLVFPKIIDSNDYFERDAGLFEDPFSTSKDGMACWNDKNEIFVLYKHMCRVYDATTFELKRNEWFMNKENSYNGLTLDHNYNQAYIKFDDLDNSGNALGGIVLYSENWPKRYNNYSYYDLRKRSNGHVSVNGSDWAAQAVSKYFSIDPISGTIVDTTRDDPTYEGSNPSHTQHTDNTSCYTPWNKQWIGCYSYDKSSSASYHYFSEARFNYSWDSGLGQWVMVPSRYLDKYNNYKLTDYRLRDDEGYEFVNDLINGKSTHTTWESLHPFSADVQVRFNELTTSPSNTLSVDDYYTNYICQDAISNDNQQYVTGFSHIMYWARAEKFSDTFAPAATHTLSATTDVQFHSVDTDDSLLYKLYYKDNTTDRFIFFDNMLTFTASDTITTPDGGTTLVFDMDDDSILSRTYNYYKGKHLRYNGETRTIVEYDDFYTTFVLDSPFTTTPTTGNGVELVSEQPASKVSSFDDDNQFIIDSDTGIITPSSAGTSYKVIIDYIAIFRSW